LGELDALIVPSDGAVEAKRIKQNFQPKFTKDACLAAIRRLAYETTFAE
jgi:hypothetical protein